jgi:hypothetical protein
LTGGRFDNDAREANVLVSIRAWRRLREGHGTAHAWKVGDLEMPTGRRGDLLDEQAWSGERLSTRPWDAIEGAKVRFTLLAEKREEVWLTYGLPGDSLSNILARLC